MALGHKTIDLLRQIPFPRLHHHHLHMQNDSLWQHLYPLHRLFGCLLMGLLHRPLGPIEESQLEAGYLALTNLPSELSFPPIFSAKKLHKL